MNDTTNEPGNETGFEVKPSTNLLIKLFDYISNELSVRKRIAGSTGLTSQFEGTYYYERDPSQTKYLRVGDEFPTVFRYGFTTEGIWVLRNEDRPRRKWHEFGHVYLTIIVLAIAIYLIRLAFIAPIP